MNDKEWTGWVSHHMLLFRWGADEDLAMMDLWRPILERKTITVSELRKASEHLAVSPAKWRADHLHGIIEYVQAQRSLALSLDRQSEHQAREVHYSCEGCKGDGLLYEMPRPDNVKDGQWVGDVACVVACWCARGKKKDEWNDGIVERYREAGKRTTGPIYPFERYEQLNPHWRHQKEQRAIEKREMAQAMSAAQTRDKVVGGPMAGLIGKVMSAAAKPTPKPSAPQATKECPF